MLTLPIVELRPDMSFDEIVRYYRSCGGYFAKVEVFERSKLSNLDKTIRRAGTCLCGYCGDDRACACGLDRVVHGRDCITCGRPWWCER